NLVLKLLPEAVISVHVTGKNGEPVEKPNLDVTRGQIIEGRWRPGQFIGASIAGLEDGFHVDGLQPGVYYLGVRGTRLSDQTPEKQRREAYPLVVYYPDTSDIASAEPIKLAAGERRE